MSEISIGTVLEQNKNIIKQQKLPPMHETKKMYGLAKSYCMERLEEYYMLYCKELSDFTVFHCLQQNQTELVQELKMCINNRGNLFSIDLTEDEIALEIWIKNAEGEPYCYYLFPYTQAVIKIGESNDCSFN